MVLVMALLVWFAVSIPAALILGRIIAAAGEQEVTLPARGALTSAHASRS
jgi:hypothetical protein